MFSLDSSKLDVGKPSQFSSARNPFIASSVIFSSRPANFYEVWKMMKPQHMRMAQAHKQLKCSSLFVTNHEALFIFPQAREGCIISALHTFLL